MRFPADENFPVASVKMLPVNGHDVLSASENMTGIGDEMILQRAHEEQRIIVTFDRDYGELIFKRQLATPLGVLYSLYAGRAGGAAAGITPNDRDKIGKSIYRFEPHPNPPAPITDAIMKKVKWL